MNTSSLSAAALGLLVFTGCGAEPAPSDASDTDLIHACAVAMGCGLANEFSHCLANVPVVASPRFAAGHPDRALYAAILQAGAHATSCEELYDATGAHLGDACAVSHCDGASAVICSGAASLVIDCAAQGSVCVVDDTSTPRCAAGPASGEPRCEGNVAVTPNAGVLVRTDCGADECAIVDGAARCLAPDDDCAFSGITCEGTVAVRCNVDGERSYTSRRDCADVFGTCDPAAERDCVISAEREAMPVGCEGTVATLLVDAYYPVEFDCASVGFTCIETSGNRPACVPAAL